VMRSRVHDAYRLGKTEGDAERAAAEATAARVPELERRIDELTQRHATSMAQLAESTTRLEQERLQSGERIALLDQARTQLADAFQALSAQSLRDNNQTFLDLAKATLERFQEGARSDLDTRTKAVETLVKPLHESLAKVGVAVQELETHRQGAYSALGEQVKQLRDGHEKLSSETARLANALRAPGVGGRWGEMQLKRVVELAGMLEHCDFTTQESFGQADDRVRPDLVVRLPGGKRVVVDAKAPLQSYLSALEATDEPTRAQALKDHARHVRTHLQALGAKSYWDRLSQSGGAPEFVVLFLPGEIFFSAAMHQDPSLIEYGVDQKVIIATPTTLIALLRAIAYGWRHEQLARNADEIASQGRNLYNRMRIFTEHLSEIGVHLERSVRTYNKAVGALESGVVPAARRFKELGAGSGEDIPLLDPIEPMPRTPRPDETGTSALGSSAAS
jgi:DNA recombination protein RmuC